MRFAAHSIGNGLAHFFAPVAGALAHQIPYAVHIEDIPEDVIYLYDGVLQITRCISPSLRIVLCTFAVGYVVGYDVVLDDRKTRKCRIAGRETMALLIVYKCLCIFHSGKMHPALDRLDRAVTLRGGRVIAVEHFLRHQNIWLLALQKV